MQLSKKKNTIILKGMASNVIEEAIVILKPNIKLKQNEFKFKNIENKVLVNKKSIILEEAERTICDYVTKLESRNIRRENIILRKRFFISTFFNIALMICIGCSIWILTK